MYTHTYTHIYMFIMFYIFCVTSQGVMVNKKGGQESLVGWLVLGMSTLVGLFYAEVSLLNMSQVAYSSWCSLVVTRLSTE